MNTVPLGPSQTLMAGFVVRRKHGRATVLAAMTVMVLAAAGCGAGSSAGGSSPPPVTTPEHAPLYTPAPATITNTPSPSLAAVPHGIVMMELGNKVGLWLLDPVTGEKTGFQSFPDAPSTLGGSVLFSRAQLTPDFRRMVLTKTMPDGSTHVGWENSSGTFTDVSAAQGATTDFASTTHDSAPNFDLQGNFYYVTNPGPGNGTSTEKVKTVPAGATTPATDLPQVQSGDAVFRSPAGTLYTVDVGSGLASLGTTLSAAGQTVASEVEQLLDEGHYLTASTGQDGQNGLAKCALGPTQDCVNLIPQTDRAVADVVVSPDGSQFAFVSSAKTLGSNRDLFTVPATGGQPTKIGDALLGTGVQLAAPVIVAWM